MVVPWWDTSPGTDSTMSWCDTGGGRECTQKLSNIAGIALSVLWYMDLVNGQSPPLQPIPVE